MWKYRTASRYAAVIASIAAGMSNAIAVTAKPSHAGKRCIVPGVRKPLGAVWTPRMEAAVDYAHRRTGDIAFAVRTDSRFFAYRPDHVEWSASVLKAMLMVAYLDRARSDVAR